MDVELDEAMGKVYVCEKCRVEVEVSYSKGTEIIKESGPELI